MRFHLKVWVIGGEPVEGSLENTLDFDVANIETAREKTEKILGDLQGEHQVSDRFVGARLYQEIESW